jgi:hypothetical protein
MKYKHLIENLINYPEVFTVTGEPGREQIALKKPDNLNLDPLHPVDNFVTNALKIVKNLENNHSLAIEASDSGKPISQDLKNLLTVDGLKILQLSGLDEFCNNYHPTQRTESTDWIEELTHIENKLDKTIIELLDHSGADGLPNFQAVTSTGKCYNFVIYETPQVKAISSLCN